MLETVKFASGLTNQQAADAFADVVNSILVALVDRAAHKLNQGDDDAIAALDEIAVFMSAAG